MRMGLPRKQERNVHHSWHEHELMVVYKDTVPRLQYCTDCKDYLFSLQSSIFLVYYRNPGIIAGLLKAWAFWSDKPGFKSRSCHLLAIQPRTDYLASLSLTLTN